MTRTSRTTGADRRLSLLIGAIILSLLLIVWQLSLAVYEREHYDLVVVGGEPGGVAAALSAARAGLRVILIEKSSTLGGTLTLARLNTFDMNYDRHGQMLTRGLFLELYRKLRGDSFDTEEAAATFLELVRQEKNISLCLEASGINPLIAGNRVDGVSLSHGGKLRLIRGTVIVDATGDADLAASAGAPFTVGAEDNDLGRRTMAATMIFQMGGINWKELAKQLRKKGDLFAGANRTSAWGFGSHAKMYEPSDPFVRVRGLNMGRQRDDTVLVNSLLLFEVDPLSAESKRMAIEKSHKEVANLISFLRGLNPELQNAYVLSYSPELYIRESRHMRGLYRLNIDDVLENRNFPDRIARGSYPADVQPLTADGVGIVVGNPVNYSIPLRCLLPPNIVNLMVVGRSTSFTSLAFSSARTIPVEIVIGEAAGIAASVAAQARVNLHQLSAEKSLYGRVQEILRERGHPLDDATIYSSADRAHPSYQDARFLRAIAIYAVGYENAMRLDLPLGESFLSKLLHYFTQRICYENTLKVYTLPLHSLSGKKPLTREEALKMLAVNWNAVCGQLQLAGSSVPESLEWEEALARRFLPEQLGKGTTFSRCLTRGEAASILHHHYRMLRILTRRPLNEHDVMGEKAAPSAH